MISQVEKHGEMFDWQNAPNNLEDYFGFVYLIVNNHPNAVTKYYIGKKQCKRKRKVNGKIVMRDNGVQSYWGSSKSLKADIEKYGISYFSRHIIELCDSKYQLSYAEAAWIIESDALFDQRFYNQGIMLRLGKAPKDVAFKESQRDIRSKIKSAEKLTALP